MHGTYIKMEKIKRHCYFSLAAVVTRISQNALPYGHFLCSLVCSVVVCIDTTELKWSI